MGRGTSQKTSLNPFGASSYTVQRFSAPAHFSLTQTARAMLEWQQQNCHRKTFLSKL